MASEYEVISDYDLQRGRFCARCGAVYHEYNNIGAWQCKQHPQEVGIDNRYRCCKRPPKTAGCQRADHREDTPAPYNIVDDIYRVRDFRMGALKGVRKEAISRELSETVQQTAVFCVYRCNPNELASRAPYI
jgi:hypothetical protein